MYRHAVYAVAICTKLIALYTAPPLILLLKYGVYHFEHRKVAQSKF